MDDAPILQMDQELLDAIQPDILYGYLEGKTSAGRLLKHLGLPVTLENKRILQNYLDRVAFQVEVQRARRDMVGSVIDRIKAKAHLWAAGMEKIAIEGKEERTKVVALKDLLDRAGTGAAQKLAISTPAQYKKLLEEFVKVEPDAEEGDT